MKKVISLVLAISMIFSLSVSSLAKETDPSPINDPYLPNVIVVENGIPKRITQVEYDQIKKESQLALNEKATAESISTDNEISPRLITFYDYTEESYLYYFDTSQKTPVTPCLKTGDEPGEINIGESYGFSASFSISLTSPEISSILGQVGSEFTISGHNSKEFGMTLRLPPNTMKRVYFTPRYYRSRGSLQKYTQNESGTSASPSGNPKRVTSELLVKVGKFIDGVYELGDA